MYALLMSTINLGTLISFQSGGLLTLALGITKTNFDNLWIIVLATNISYLLPLPLLACVKIEQYDKKDETEEERLAKKERLNEEERLTEGVSKQNGKGYNSI
jgi:hypothetical protein